MRVPSNVPATSKCIDYRYVCAQKLYDLSNISFRPLSFIDYNISTSFLAVHVKVPEGEFSSLPAAILSPMANLKYFLSGEVVHERNKEETTTNSTVQFCAVALLESKDMQQLQLSSSELLHARLGEAIGYKRLLHASTEPRKYSINSFQLLRFR